MIISLLSGGDSEEFPRAKINKAAHFLHFGVSFYTSRLGPPFREERGSAAKGLAVQDLFTYL